jgi:hypothetical protein
LDGSVTQSPPEPHGGKLKEATSLKGHANGGYSLPEAGCGVLNRECMNSFIFRYLQCAVLVIAAWCLYSDKGVNRHNRKLDIVDEKKS